MPAYQAAPEALPRDNEIIDNFEAFHEHHFPKYDKKDLERAIEEVKQLIPKFGGWEDCLRENPESEKYQNLILSSLVQQEQTKLDTSITNKEKTKKTKNKETSILTTLQTKYLTTRTLYPDADNLEILQAFVSPDPETRKAFGLEAFETHPVQAELIREALQRIQQAKNAIENPAEQQAFQEILANTPIDITSREPAVTFAAVAVAIESTPTLSPTTKQHILSHLGVQPPIQNTLDIQDALQSGHPETQEPYTKEAPLYLPGGGVVYQTNTPEGQDPSHYIVQVGQDQFPISTLEATSSTELSETIKVAILFRLLRDIGFGQHLENFETLFPIDAPDEHHEDLAQKMYSRLISYLQWGGDIPSQDDMDTAREKLLTFALNEDGEHTPTLIPQNLRTLGILAPDTNEFNQKKFLRTLSLIDRTYTGSRLTPNQIQAQMSA